ncbi:MAG: T9SS type A sorting domain-containing protein [Bacteroidota bacterium]
MGEYRGALFMREDVPTGVEMADPLVFLKFNLLDPYPNPFNSTVTIQFTIEQQKEIKLSIFDLLGREVNVLAEGSYQTGRYRTQWQGTNASGALLPTGVYFVRLQSSKATLTKRVLLLR